MVCLDFAFQRALCWSRGWRLEATEKSVWDDGATQQRADIATVKYDAIEKDVAAVDWEAEVLGNIRSIGASAVRDHLWPIVPAPPRNAWEDILNGGTPRLSVELSSASKSLRLLAMSRRPVCIPNRAVHYL